MKKKCSLKCDFQPAYDQHKSYRDKFYRMQVLLQVVESMHDYLHFEISTDLAFLYEQKKYILTDTENFIYKRTAYFDEAFIELNDKIKRLKGDLQEKWIERLIELQQKKQMLSKYIRTE